MLGEHSALTSPNQPRDGLPDNIPTSSRAGLLDDSDKVAT